MFSGESRALTYSGAASARSTVDEVLRSSESDRTQSRMSEDCTLTRVSVRVQRQVSLPALTIDEHVLSRCFRPHPGSAGAPRYPIL